MPTETIVNRVSPTLGLIAETEKLRQQDEREERASHIEKLKSELIEAESLGLQKPEDPTGTVGLAQLKTAEGERAGKVGSIELPPDTPYSPESERLSEGLKASVGLPTLNPVVFRGQVIAAFKHLGLDTRKFFGV